MAAVSLIEQDISGTIISENLIQFPFEKISVQQFIEGKVIFEMERRTKDFQPDPKELILNQKSASQKDLLQAAQQQAIKGFLSNRYFLFLNDAQLTDLQQEILVTPNSKVRFIQLIPLVGG